MTKEIFITKARSFLAFNNYMVIDDGVQWCFKSIAKAKAKAKELGASGNWVRQRLATGKRGKKEVYFFDTGES
jgi:hypothetical protein